MSWLFSAAPPADPHAPNFHSVTDRYKEDELFGKLEPKDTEWLATTTGFVTETQTFYTVTDEGKFISLQVIHGSVGLWYPNIQLTAKIHDPKTGETTWRSINVNNFVISPPGLDKRSCKADEFSITHKQNSGAEYAESYSIKANFGTDLQVFLDFHRFASIPGFKVGNGAQGGYSYFGPDMSKPEGYVVHRFWPRCNVSGNVIINGRMFAANGSGMMVHAIQGMRPNLVASRWNFTYFQSEQLGGVSGIQMEFTTCDTHGKKGAGSGPVVITVGSLVVDGKLACVTGATKWPGEEVSSSTVSRVSHINCELDPDTTYNKPSGLLFEWAGKSMLEAGTVKAKVEIDVGNVAQPKGLVEKVDVLAEIPYVIKMAVSYVAGTKPYMYQWLNEATMSITRPSGETAEVEGVTYTEATFIS